MADLQCTTTQCFVPIKKWRLDEQHEVGPSVTIRRAKKRKRRYDKPRPVRMYKKSNNPLQKYKGKAVGYNNWKEMVAILRKLASLGDAGQMGKAGARKTPS